MINYIMSNQNLNKNEFEATATIVEYSRPTYLYFIYIIVSFFVICPYLYIIYKFATSSNFCGIKDIK